MDRETFLENAKPVVEVVKTRAGSIKIRSLSELDVSTYEAWGLNGGTKVDTERDKLARAKLIVMAAVADDETAPLFTEADVERLAKAPADIVMPLYLAAKRAAGYLPGLAEQVKNSAADPAA